MAIKKCKECGANVSTKAESCPHCGARLKAKPMGCGGLLAVVVLGFIIVGAFGSILDGSSSSGSSSSRSGEDGRSNSGEKSPSPSQSDKSNRSFETDEDDKLWSYSVSNDSMSGKVEKSASLTSSNSLHLDFPYNGQNYGRLTVRNHPQYGLDVIVSVTKGQILCEVYTCHLKIRFDDGSLEKFTMAPAADHSSTVVFAKYPNWAIKHLRNARNILIQLPMYQSGNQVLRFEVDKPLVWPPP